MARSEGKRTLAGDQEEVVGDVGLDWEPVKVEVDVLERVQGFAGNPRRDSG